jgi:hypothetical protein
MSDLMRVPRSAEGLKPRLQQEEEQLMLPALAPLSLWRYWQGSIPVVWWCGSSRCLTSRQILRYKTKQITIEVLW